MLFTVRRQENRLPFRLILFRSSNKIFRSVEQLHPSVDLESFEKSKRIGQHRVVARRTSRRQIGRRGQPSDQTRQIKCLPICQFTAFEAALPEKYLYAGSLGAEDRRSPAGMFFQQFTILNHERVRFVVSRVPDDKYASVGMEHSQKFRPGSFHIELVK